VMIVTALMPVVVSVIRITNVACDWVP